MNASRKDCHYWKTRGSTKQANEDSTTTRPEYQPVPKATNRAAAAPQRDGDVDLTVSLLRDPLLPLPRRPAPEQTDTVGGERG
jgi:hypothetical protein